MMVVCRTPTTASRSPTSGRSCPGYGRRWRSSPAVWRRKAVTFDSDVFRWVVALPPIVGGVALAAYALKRRGGYEAAMRERTPLRAGQGLPLIVGAICAYGVIALVAIVLDG